MDDDITSRFASSCQALGLSVYGRQRPADLVSAKSGFSHLSRIAHNQGDVWVGLAAAGDISLPVRQSIVENADTLGFLMRAVEIAPGTLGFRYHSGLYVEFGAFTREDFDLAYASGLLGDGQLRAAHSVIQEVLHRSPGCLEAAWISVAISYQARRWSDVARLLTPLVGAAGLDKAFSQVTRVALGIALAKLGMLTPALTHLEDCTGPSAAAAIDGGFARALVLRGLGDEAGARIILQELDVLSPGDAQILAALDDPSYGLTTTTADRISARTDPWDADTEPSAEQFVSADSRRRKETLLDAAERDLASFIGMVEVKAQVARLKSSVKIGLLRQERGLAVASRSHHLVFAGPPGTGKTTVARIVAKIYCGLGLLKKETVKEVHRADLIGQHIGETEAKTNAVIDSALDGVLFLDEAYSLVATGAKNDFGLVAMNTLLARMENDRDRLVVIIAGYRAELERLLATNEGLRSRFAQTISFDSYTPAELVEMAVRLAATRDSVFDSDAMTELEQAFSCLSDSRTPDTAGTPRRGIDIAGNGRFVRNLVERAEIEREYRLDNGADYLSDTQLMTIDAADTRHTIAVLLRNLGLSSPCDRAAS